METYFPSSMWIESRIPIQLHLHLYYCCRCLLRLRHDFQSIFIFACINKNETCHSHRPKKSSYLLFTPFTFADMLVVGSFNIEGFFNFIPLYRTNIDLFSTFYFSRHLTRAIGYAKNVLSGIGIFSQVNMYATQKKIILFGFKLTWPALNVRFFHPISCDILNRFSTRSQKESL